MSVRVELTGTQRAARKLLAFGIASTQACRRATYEAAKNVERNAKANAPFKDGVLRASIDSLVSDERPIAFVGVHKKKPAAAYAPAIEFGRGVKRKGRKVTAAQPYLFPAAAAEGPLYKGRVTREMKREIAGVRP